MSRAELTSSETGMTVAPRPYAGQEPLEEASSCRATRRRTAGDLTAAITRLIKFDKTCSNDPFVQVNNFRTAKLELTQTLRPSPCDAAGGHGGMNMKLLIVTTEKLGAKSGMTTIFPARALLSDRIYKIRTLLSTGFVDNARAADDGDPLAKPYLARVSGHRHAAHWANGRL